jgi:hypothetical protein
MTLAGFETAIPAGERPKAQALERAATSITGALRLSLICLHARGRATFSYYYSDPDNKMKRTHKSLEQRMCLCIVRSC